MNRFCYVLCSWIWGLRCPSLPVGAHHVDWRSSPPPLLGPLTKQSIKFSFFVLVFAGRLLTWLLRYFTVHPYPSKTQYYVDLELTHWHFGIWAIFDSQHRPLHPSHLLSTQNYARSSPTEYYDALSYDSPQYSIAEASSVLRQASAHLKLGLHLIESVRLSAWASVWQSQASVPILKPFVGCFPLEGGSPPA